MAANLRHGIRDLDGGVRVFYGFSAGGSCASTVPGRSNARAVWKYNVPRASPLVMPWSQGAPYCQREGSWPVMPIVGIRYRSSEPRLCDMRTIVSYCATSVSYSRSVRSAIKTVCVRLPGSTTTSCARAGTTSSATKARQKMMRFMESSLPALRQQRATTGRWRLIGREVEVVRQIDLDAVAFPDGDVGQAIQVSIHRLRGRLGGRFTHAARDDHGAPAASTEPGGSDELRQPRDETDGGGRAERRAVMLIDLIAEPGVAEPVQAHEQ